MDRGERYEDPLDAFLKANGLGEVSGGGTQLLETGEIEYCEVELQLTSVAPEVLDAVAQQLQSAGAPKGSVLVALQTAPSFPSAGRKDWPSISTARICPTRPTATATSTSSLASSTGCWRARAPCTAIGRAQPKPRSTCMATSYEAMQTALADFIASYPLCARRASRRSPEAGSRSRSRSPEPAASRTPGSGSRPRRPTCR